MTEGRRPAPSRPVRLLVLAALVAASVVAAPVERAAAATLATGFSDDLVVSISSPTALAFTPDGRMLVTSQTGQLRVVEDGVLRTQPALDLSARMCLSNERGLLGVAVDPAFTTNRFVYLYWTAKVTSTCPRLTAGAPVNRVSRFVLPETNVISSSSETVLIDKIPSPGGFHNAGDLAFGKDGFLYVTVGDGGCDYAGDSGCGGDNDAARDKHVLLGKVLRVNRNGGIPPSNPFASTGDRCNVTGRTTAGNHCQETFAWGLRNPFRFAFDPNATGTRFFINDVGQDFWEEVDLGIAGADYGWSVREGHCAKGSATSCDPPPEGMTNPIYDYSHDAGCSSITGGAFVPDGLWPAAYEGAYLYGDYVCGAIFSITPASGGGFDVATLASGLGESSAVHLEFGPHGATQALYYTTFAAGGQIRRISFTGDGNRTPTASFTATPLGGPTPLTVDFDARASTDPDGDALRYLWTFGDGTPTVETLSPTVSHQYTSEGRVTASLRVRDPAGATSPALTVAITPGNEAPSVDVVAPDGGARYAPGTAITLRATATDAEDGALPGASLSWQVVRRHDGHTHPFLPPTTGSQVSITYPGPEDANDVTSFLRATVTATDTTGATATATVDLRPKDALTIGDVAVREGAAGAASALVPVTLHRQACGGTCPTTTVSFTTAAGSAAAGSDFVSTAGTLTFGPAETTKHIAVPVKGDTAREPDERFSVRLSRPSATATVRDGGAEVLVLSDETAPALPIRINAGGAGYTSATGTRWLADRGFTGGRKASVTAAIAGTIDDRLYRSERNGLTGYHLLVPNGTYRVRLHFAEISACCTEPGRRVFDVAVEGDTVLDAFDILTRTARNTALVQEAVVVVDDGILDVTFRPRTHVPTISGIEIVAS